MCTLLTSGQVASTKTILRAIAAAGTDFGTPGLADFLLSKNINVFGPSQAAAQLEGSKTFSKDFLL